MGPKSSAISVGAKRCLPKNKTTQACCAPMMCLPPHWPKPRPSLTKSPRWGLYNRPAQMSHWSLITRPIGHGARNLKALISTISG